MTKFLILVLVLAGAVTAPGHVRADDDKYQLMKASEERVWRLNKATGEISVCALQDDLLLCTKSTEVMAPANKSFADIKAERAAAEKAAREHKRKQDEMEVKILDRILAFFREIITMAKEQEAAK